MTKRIRMTPCGAMTGIIGSRRKILGLAGDTGTCAIFQALEKGLQLTG